MEYAVSNNNKRFRTADARWLAVAVLAHAALLLIPLRERAPVSVDAPAQILLDLVTVEQPAAEPPTVPEKTRATQSLPEGQPRTEPEGPTVPETENPVIPQPAFVPGPPEPTVTMARLMGLRDTVAEAVPLDPDPAGTARRLGTPDAFELPHNWQRGAGAQALAPFDNTFNGKTVPVETEIVDRWLAADGSHHVVVETPAGLRMCGRARSWDPMQPLVEHIMMWKVCGGDGKVPFKFKPREPLDRDFIVPVAKDATEP